ncbi:MAG TPA: hypothetical protein PLC53_02040 [Bacilli bacterium]|nr:hypothetical protein [Bacilli bacterium]
MANKKLGISTFELNMQFKDENEANKYAKRLKEYIRYICEKKVESGLYAQATICISNIKGNSCFQYYEHNGKRGRPPKNKRFYNNDNQSIDWHMHILLVSNPDYAFREVIKNYIDKKKLVIKSY